MGMNERTHLCGSCHEAWIGVPASSCPYCRANKAEAEVEQLQTWKGLMEILDKHYPADLVDGSSGDPGPRLIVALRALDQLRTDRAVLVNWIKGSAHLPLSRGWENVSEIIDRVISERRGWRQEQAANDRKRVDEL